MNDNLANPNIDVQVSLEAACEGDGYHMAGLRQWAQACPHMSDGERNLLGILGSLVNESRGRSLRKLTLAHIAALLPSTKVPLGAEEKRPSISSVRDRLKELARIGQLTSVDGSPLHVTSKPDTPMTILVHTYPRHDCGRRRNTRDALSVACGEQPWWGLTEVAGNPVPPVQVARQEEARPLQADTPADASDEAMDLAAEVLPSRKMRDVRRLAERIDAALGDGWTLERLARMLKVKYRAEKVVDLVGFMVSRLPDPGETPPVKTGGRGKVKPLPIHDCPNCYGTGHEEDATGLLTGRKCLHPALARPTPA